MLFESVTIFFNFVNVVCVCNVCYVFRAGDECVVVNYVFRCLLFVSVCD